MGVGTVVTRDHAGQELTRHASFLASFSAARAGLALACARGGGVGGDGCFGAVWERACAGPPDDGCYLNPSDIVGHPDMPPPDRARGRVHLRWHAGAAWQPPRGVVARAAARTLFSSAMAFFRRAFSPLDTGASFLTLLVAAGGLPRECG